MAEMVDIHALAGAYALDAVDDLERAAFDRHLRGCASCTLEVAELKETVAWLSHPVAEPAPPGLRAVVLAEVARTPQERARSGSGGSSTSLTKWRRWTAAAVAASVLGLGVGAGTWAIAEQRLRAERQANAQFQAVLSAPDARLVKTQMAGGEVNLVVSESRDAAVAVVTGLNALPPDRTYQLWLCRHAQRRSAIGRGAWCGHDRRPPVHRRAARGDGLRDEQRGQHRLGDPDRRSSAMSAEADRVSRLGSARRLWRRRGPARHALTPQAARTLEA